METKKEQILIRIDETLSGGVMKELLFKTTELGVTIGFEPIPDEDYEAWAGRQGKNRYILTAIGRSLSARQIEAADRGSVEAVFQSKAS